MIFSICDHGSRSIQQAVGTLHQADSEQVELVSSGRLIWDRAAGHVVNDAHGRFDAIAWGRRSEMVKDRGKQVSIGELVIGSRASSPYYDSRGVLLIAGGVEITPGLVEKLRRHGVEMLYTDEPRPSATGKVAVRVPSEDRTRSVRPASARPDPTGSGQPKPQGAERSLREGAERSLRVDAVAEAGTRFVPRRAAGRRTEPWADSRPSLRSYPRHKVERLEKLYHRCLETVDRLIDGLIAGQTPPIRETDPVIDAYLKELADDADVVVAGSLLYEANLDLAQRCLQFSTLSLAVGTRTDLAPSQLRELGRAALVHDWGLFELPPESRFPHQAMTDEQRGVYQRHPLRAETMIQSIRDASFSLAVLVAQVHETMNGGGFPRRLRGNEIHPLARLLGVIDTYLMLTAPPPGHRRVVPCDAVAFLLQGVRSGQYAPTAVSALLETVTLYPIGSLVELSDTSQARVVRTNGRDYGYPIVERIDAPGEWVDLKRDSLFVTRPVLVPEYNEVRLPETFTDLSSI